MKHRTNTMLAIISFVLLLAACGQANTPAEVVSASAEVPTWQEQYDLGLRYLSEGNYAVH